MPFDELKSEVIDSGLCCSCGTCVSVCPQDAITIPLGEVGSEKRRIASCQANCPAHINVQGYITLVAQRKYDEALKLIKEENPLPAICGRVCHHPCESFCNRKEVDKPVAIDSIKRFVADLDLNSETRYIPDIKEQKKEKVAIIGSGPAGLSCAYYLAIEGYQLTIYEKLPVAGGMLSVGIPEYRLPRDIINAEIQVIRDMGVEIKTGVNVGQDVTIEQLCKEGNKALFLAIGAHECEGLGIEGEHLGGVFPGIDFLRDVNVGEKTDLGDRVAVIGGGNVAMDAARTALRTGSREAFILYRRSFEEMPANEEEIEECKEEGIKIHTLTNPKKIIGENDKVKAIECLKMELGEPDEGGRRQPIPIDGSEFVIEVDAVVPAIGQESDWACLTPECACTLTDWNTVNVDPLTLQTDDPDIFAGGDAVTGAKTVIEAIEAGKQAAISMDRYIRGVDLREGRKKEWETVQNVSIEDYDPTPRTPMPRLEPEGRLDNFKEVQQGFSEEQAVAEAKRCISCECSDCHDCVEVCPGKNLPISEMEQMIFGRTRATDPLEKMFGVYKYHVVTHAVSDDVHQTGVAGASVSTLLIHGLETGFLDAAIVAGYDKEKPWQVRPYVVTDREGVLAAARSKYGVCSTNMLLAEAAEKYEKIGVVACPCQVMGIRKMALRELNPKITDRIKLIIGLYCLAQNFSTAAEYMITQRMGTKLEDVAQFQYRGGARFGGGTWLKKKDGEERSMELLGNWGMVPTVFIGYQMERCYVCEDHVSELADISCGDVWGRHVELHERSNMGWTGIFVRTQVGEEIIESAVKAGVLFSERDDTIADYYCVNPGHSKKRFANPKRIEHRKRYGWAVPKIT